MATWPSHRHGPERRAMGLRRPDQRGAPPSEGEEVLIAARKPGDIDVLDNLGSHNGQNRSRDVIRGRTRTALLTSSPTDLIASRIGSLLCRAKHSNPQHKAHRDGKPQISVPLERYFESGTKTTVAALSRTFRSVRCSRDLLGVSVRLGYFVNKPGGCKKSSAHPPFGHHPS